MGEEEIVAIQWCKQIANHSTFSVFNEFAQPPFDLCICFANGLILLTHDTPESNPTILKTQLQKISACCWSCKGDILAISGSFDSLGIKNCDRAVNVVQFYNCYGTYLRTLRVPGEDLSSIAWERSG
jgi:WD repeat-containing protein 35